MEKFIQDLFNAEILEQAAEKFDLKKEDLKELGGFESFIYEFNKNEQSYILRITHSSRRTPAMIEAEMDWIEYLHNHGVNCSLPCHSHAGHLIETVGEENNQFIVCAFDKVPGGRLTRVMDNPEFRYNYGKQIGKMHRVTKDYQNGKSRRIEWYQDDLIENFASVVSHEDTLVKNFNANTEQIHAMQKTTDNYGLVHFDAHTGNFFVQDNEIFVFDFDDCQYAYFAADIAIVLFYFAGYCPKEVKVEDFMLQFYQEFMKGYVSENTISQEELSKIPIFLKQREFMLYAAIKQAYGDAEYDNWAKWYMTGRKEKLENETPFIDLDF